MRYTYIFENKINRETIQELINDIHDKEEVDLYFSTNGGEIFPMRSFIHYLNSRKESIQLYLTDRLVSAGTLLLTDFKGAINITPELEFMLFHKIDCEEYQFRKDDINRAELKRQLKEDNEILAEKLKGIGFTEKQLKVFKEGKDLLLYKKDFKCLNIGKL